MVMELIDKPPPPDGAVPTSDFNRSSKRWAVLAAVLCPCHLWLVAGVVGFLGAGAAASAIRDNQTLLVVVLVPLSALALWRSVASGRRAAEMRRRGQTCAVPSVRA
jgi:hypothetical protein